MRCNPVAGDTRSVATRPLPERDTLAHEIEARRGESRSAPAPAGLDVLGLQRAAGNRATARMLGSLRRLHGARGLQRAVIPAAGINGLVGNLDTANLDASKVQIDQMWNGGKRRGLSDLYAALGQAAAADAHRANNEALRAYVKRYLDMQRGADPMAGDSPLHERWYFDFWNQAHDETGMTQIPGQGEQSPANPTRLQTAALAVRSWQIGDIVDGVSWSTLGRHLQKRMTQQDYVTLGGDIVASRSLKGIPVPPGMSPVDKELVARASCARVSREIGAGLQALPKTEGVSYRAATAAVGVYGTAINVGDLVKDRAFWSTAGLRMSHRNTSFGSEGTLATPKVYYIINGRTGVFLPRYTDKEVGVREILYKSQTIFRVTKITNYADRTFFVWVDEADPATLGVNPATKNPWSGAVNRF
jgi:hypothetical protein